MPKYTRFATTTKAAVAGQENAPRSGGDEQEIVVGNEDPRRPVPEVPAAHTTPVAIETAVADDEGEGANEHRRRRDGVGPAGHRIWPKPRRGEESRQQKKPGDHKDHRPPKERPTAEPEHRLDDRVDGARKSQGRVG